MPRLVWCLCLKMRMLLKRQHDAGALAGQYFRFRRIARGVDILEVSAGLQATVMASANQMRVSQENRISKLNQPTRLLGVSHPLRPQYS